MASRAPTPIDAFDTAEIDDIPFRLGAYLQPGETVANVDVSCRSVGEEVVDPTPNDLVAVPHELQGSDIVQRIDATAGALGARYVVRVRATLSSGRVLVGAALFELVQL